MANDLSGTTKAKRSHKRRTIEEKRLIVEETLMAGASVSVVARRHDVNANQLFSWRRQYKCGELSGPTKAAHGLIALGVIGSQNSPSEPVPVITQVPIPAPQAQKPRQAPEQLSPKMIEIELGGGMRVRLDGDVRLPVLHCVLKMVRGLA